MVQCSWHTTTTTITHAVTTTTASPFSSPANSLLCPYSCLCLVDYPGLPTLTAASRSDHSARCSNPRDLIAEEEHNSNMRVLSEE